MKEFATQAFEHIFNVLQNAQLDRKAVKRYSPGLLCMIPPSAKMVVAVM